MKQQVVEMDNLSGASIIILQGFYLWSERLKLMLHGTEQQAPIAIAPAVNGLLYISYYQVIIALCKGFSKQGQKIIPLKTTRILKLINQVMLITMPGFFINKRCVSILCELPQQVVCITN